MKRTILSIMAILLPLWVTASEGALYRTTVNMVSGRPLMPTSITVEEVERTPTTSVIEVSTSAGTEELVSSAALIGMCGLARKRGERYIQARQISRRPLTLEVTFPKVGSESSSPPASAVAPNIFPVASCPPSA